MLLPREPTRSTTPFIAKHRHLETTWVKMEKKHTHKTDIYLAE